MWPENNRKDATDTQGSSAACLLAEDFVRLLSGARFARFLWYDLQELESGWKSAAQERRARHIRHHDHIFAQSDGWQLCATLRFSAYFDTNV